MVDEIIKLFEENVTELVDIDISCLWEYATGGVLRCVVRCVGRRLVGKAY